MKSCNSLTKGLGASLTILIVLLTSLTSCSKKNKTPQPIKEKFFVLGNPYNIVKGSTFNDKIDIPDEIIKRNKYNLFTYYIFSEKTEVIDSSDIKKGHENRDISFSETPNDSEPFVIKKSDDSQSYQITNGEITLSIKKDDSGKTIIYLLTNKETVAANNPKSKIVKAEDQTQETEKAQLLHVSFTEDYSAFSLLAFDDTASDRSLMALYFGPVIQSEDAPQKDSSDFFYILGKSIPMKWDTRQQLQVHFCQKNNDNESTLEYQKFRKYYPAAQSAIKNWRSHLLNRLDLSLNVLTHYPPFSDLNTKCIYIVPDYFYSSNKQALFQGANLSLPNYKSKTLIDSDIFIFDKEEQKLLDYIETKVGTNISNLDYELQKLLNEELQSNRLFVMTHEFGHLLGLGHPFTEHEDDNIYSVMNYNSATSITSYDIKSLHHLYPIRQNSDTEPEIGRAKNIQSPYLFEAFSKSDDEIIKTSEL